VLRCAADRTRALCRPPSRERFATGRACTLIHWRQERRAPPSTPARSNAAALYRPSPRAYDARLPPIDYPGHFLVKRVANAGTFRFKHRLKFIAHALAPHTIGLEEVDEGIWSIYFGQVLLARLDERDYIMNGRVDR
jgi:hypothetical protein